MLTSQKLFKMLLYALTNKKTHIYTNWNCLICNEWSYEICTLKIIAWNWKIYDFVVRSLQNTALVPHNPTSVLKQTHQHRHHQRHRFQKKQMSRCQRGSHHNLLGHVHNKSTPNNYRYMLSFSPTPLPPTGKEDSILQIPMNLSINPRGRMIYLSSTMSDESILHPTLYYAHNRIKVCCCLTLEILLQLSSKISGSVNETFFA